MSARDRIRHGKGELVVTGTAKTGFRLANRDGAGGLSPFGPTYPKQKEAQEAGKAKFGRDAKITRPKRAAA
jgi:hypothetical protein